jgi:hypothetical protein
MLRGSGVEKKTFYIGSLRVKLMFSMPKRSSNKFGPHRRIEIGCSSIKFKHYLQLATKSPPIKLKDESIGVIL